MICARNDNPTVHEELKNQGAVVLVARCVDDVAMFVEGYLAVYRNPLPVHPKNYSYRDGRPASR